MEKGGEGFAKMLLLWAGQLRSLVKEEGAEEQVRWY